MGLFDALFGSPEDDRWIDSYWGDKLPERRIYTPEEAKQKKAERKNDDKATKATLGYLKEDAAMKINEAKRYVGYSARDVQYGKAYAMMAAADAKKDKALGGLAVEREKSLAQSRQVNQESRLQAQNYSAQFLGGFRLFGRGVVS